MEYEIWSRDCYQFTYWGEDPWEAADSVRNARVILVQRGVRTEL